MKILLTLFFWILLSCVSSEIYNTFSGISATHDSFPSSSTFATTDIEMKDHFGYYREFVWYQDLYSSTSWLYSDHTASWDSYQLNFPHLRVNPDRALHATFLSLCLRQAVLIETFTDFVAFHHFASATKTWNSSKVLGSFQGSFSVVRSNTTNCKCHETILFLSKDAETFYEFICHQNRTYSNKKIADYKLSQNLSLDYQAASFRRTFTAFIRNTSLLQYHYFSNQFSKLKVPNTCHPSNAQHVPTYDRITKSKIIFLFEFENFLQTRKCAFALNLKTQLFRRVKVLLPNNSKSPKDCLEEGTKCQIISNGEESQFFIVQTVANRTYVVYVIRQTGADTWQITNSSTQAKQFSENMKPIPCSGPHVTLNFEIPLNRISILDSKQLTWHRRLLSNSKYRFPSFYKPISAVHSSAKNSCFILTETSLDQYNYYSGDWSTYSLRELRDNTVGSPSYDYHMTKSNSHNFIVFGGFNDASAKFVSSLKKCSDVLSPTALKCRQIDHTTPVPRASASISVYSDVLFVYGGLTHIATDTIRNELVYRKKVTILFDFWVYNFTSNVWTEQKCDVKLAHHFVAKTGDSFAIYGLCNKFNELTDVFNSNYSRHAASGYTMIDAPFCLYVYFIKQRVWSKVGTMVQDFVVTTPKGPASISHSLFSVGYTRLAFTSYRSKKGKETLSSVSITPGCKVGYSSSNALRIPCTPCKKGTFSSVEGSQKCTSCPEGTTTSGTGAASKRDCAVCNDDGHCSNGDCFVIFNSTEMIRECKCHSGFSGSKCRHNVTLTASLASTFCCVLVGLIMAAVSCLKNSSKKKRLLLEQTSKEKELLNKAWNVCLEEVVLKEAIGNGGFGDVHRAIYRESMLVAVKKLSTIHLGLDEIERDFLREIEFLKTVRHPNIVLFLGAGKMPIDGCPFLLLEFVARGSLGKILRDDIEPMNYMRKLQCVYQAAKALNYLHRELDPPSTHRDVKADNLLVSQSWVIKLADFGFARLVQKEGVGQKFRNNKEMRRSEGWFKNSNLMGQEMKMMSKGIGTTLWNSPEVLTCKSCGTASDIYR